MSKSYFKCTALVIALWGTYLYIDSWVFRNERKFLGVEKKSPEELNKIIRGMFLFSNVNIKGLPIKPKTNAIGEPIEFDKFNLTIHTVPSRNPSEV